MEMDSKELQLEQITQRAVKNAKQLNLAPPIFELYAALLSLSLAVLMFLFPNLLAGSGGFYDMMMSVASQGAWAISFFLGGVSCALGMLANRKWLRIFGLAILSLMYGMLTLIYALLLPNFGFLLMLWITVFTIASIPLVKYTGVWNKRENEYGGDF